MAMLGIIANTNLFSLNKSDSRSATVSCDKTVAHCNYPRRGPNGQCTVGQKLHPFIFYYDYKSDLHGIGTSVL